jgi:hypothetical protein
MHPRRIGRQSSSSRYSSAAISGNFYFFGRFEPQCDAILQPFVDMIYVMEGGRIQQKGTYKELVSKAFDFTAMLKQVNLKPVCYLDQFLSVG